MRIIRIEGPAWFAQAACRGEPPNEWVPDPDHKKSTQRQRAVCAGCEVRSACLDYALDDDQLVGIWGGTSEEQRDVIREKRKQ